MKELSNKEYRARGVQTPVGLSPHDEGIFSWLTPDELQELRKAIDHAYQNMYPSDRRRKWSTMACQPTQAAKFVNRVNAEIEALKKTIGEMPQRPLTTQDIADPQDTVDAFFKEHGYWAEHPDYPTSDWRHEVACDDTRQGYQGWIVSQLETEDLCR